MPSTLRVYYNSACPVCNAGIHYQKNKSVRCDVQWHDVHLDHALVNELNADLEFVRERLHVLDQEGCLHVGFEAFIVIWDNSAGEQWKARLARIPGIRWLLNRVYNLFAWGLYRWNRALKHW